jgi:hypothetical protein
VNPFTPFTDWLAYLDSPEGIEHRRHAGQKGNDLDLIALLPTGAGQAILTVGDVRRLVEAGREWGAGRQAEDGR